MDKQSVAQNSINSIGGLDTASLFVIGLGLIYLLYITFRKRHSPTPMEFNALGVGVRGYVLALVVLCFAAEGMPELAILAAIAGATVAVAQVSLVQGMVTAWASRRFGSASLDALGLLMILFVVLVAATSAIEASATHEANAGAAQSSEVQGIDSQLLIAVAAATSLQQQMAQCPTNTITYCTGKLEKKLQSQQAKIDTLNIEKVRAKREHLQSGHGVSGAMTRLMMRYSGQSMTDARLSVAQLIALFLELFGMIMHIRAALVSMVKEGKQGMQESGKSIITKAVDAMKMYRANQPLTKLEDAEKNTTETCSEDGCNAKLSDDRKGGKWQTRCETHANVAREVKSNEKVKKSMLASEQVKKAQSRVGG